LDEIYDFGQVKGDNNRLFFKETEVAIVYFRAGYTPKDYPTSKVMS
jgi:glutathione synthase